MENIEFTKMHGCGNDYIYINCLEKEYENKSEIAVKLSDRHFGIGGDGVVFICPSDRADAQMRMFNLDGSEGKMCGNAIRCVAKYLYDRKLTASTTVSIETLSGIKTLSLSVENGKCISAKVNMGKAVLKPADIPVAAEGESVTAMETVIGGKPYTITCVSMGNPHCIVFVSNPDEIEIEKIGPLFEYDKMFPERVNTEFVQIINESSLKMRVWERGSGETLACGTGACASAVAAVLNGFCKKSCDITVKLRGGELVINYTDECVYMTGPATEVFSGTIEF